MSTQSQLPRTAVFRRSAHRPHAGRYDATSLVERASRNECTRPGRQLCACSATESAERRSWPEDTIDNAVGRLSPTESVDATQTRTNECPRTSLPKLRITGPLQLLSPTPDSGDFISQHMIYRRWCGRSRGSVDIPNIGRSVRLAVRWLATGRFSPRRVRYPSRSGPRRPRSGPRPPARSGVPANRASPRRRVRVPGSCRCRRRRPRGRS